MNFLQFKNKKMNELLPIKDIENDYFILSDNSIIDVFQIKTKNLSSASEDEIEFDIMQFSRLYKVYGDDLKIVSLNFPTNTKEQQNYVLHKINSTNNTIYKMHLQEKLSQLVWIEKNMTDREYYLFIFSNDNLKHKDNIATLEKCIENHLKKIDIQKKKQILYQINNKNTAIFI